MRRGILLAILAAVTVGISAPRSADAATLVKLKATLSGNVEQPTMGDMHGRGTATFNLYPSRGRVCFTLTVKFVKGPYVAAHIHRAKAGSAGPIKVTLIPPASNGKSSGCVSAPKSVVSDIAKHPGTYYVNVHTAKYPNGAVRGQLTR